MSGKVNIETARLEIHQYFREVGVPLTEEGAVPGRVEVEAQRALLADLRRDPWTVSLLWMGACLLPNEVIDGSLRALLIGLLIGVGGMNGEPAARIGAKDPDWRVRLVVAEGAWKLGVTKQREILALLKDDPDSEVRAAAESWQKMTLEERSALFRADPWQDLPPVPPPQPPARPAPRIVRLPAEFKAGVFLHPLPEEEKTSRPDFPEQGPPQAQRCEIPIRRWKAADGSPIGLAADRPCEHGIFPCSAGFPEEVIRELLG